MLHGQETEAIWQELPALPRAVANNAVTAVNNSDGTVSLYSFMGIEDPTNSLTATARAHRLDLPGGSWQPIADAPLLDGSAKIGANAVTVAGEVYLQGGYSISGFLEVTEPRLFRYDEAADLYVQLADVPVEVDDTVTGVYQDRYLYLVSGWHGPANDGVDNVQVYDTVTDTWQQATPIPGPLPGLFGHAGGLVGNQILYFDGVDSDIFTVASSRVFLGTIDPDGIGDVTRVDWVELDPHPGQPTYRAAASQGPVLGEGLLVVGGTDNPYNFTGTGYDGNPSLPLDQVLYYSFEADRWREIPAVGDHLPTMDHRGLVGAGKSWVTIGGMTAPGEATDRVYHLRLRRRN